MVSQQLSTMVWHQSSTMVHQQQSAIVSFVTQVPFPAHPLQNLLQLLFMKILLIANCYPDDPDCKLDLVMSLAPKIVEVSEFILRNDVDLACITETWLKDRIADGVVYIPGYSIIRRDRKKT